MKLSLRAAGWLSDIADEHIVDAIGDRVRNLSTI